MNREYVFDEALGQCPLCYWTSFVLFEVASNRGAILHYHICRRCGVVFQSPRMKSEVIERFYQNGYRAHDIREEKPMDWVVEQEQKRARYQLDLLIEWRQKPPRLLDIGASTGQFLCAASEKFNCVSVAVEPGDIYRSNLSRMFQAYPTVEVLIAAGEARFDLIALSHVLEHLPEPVKFLGILREHVLTPNGFLFVEVPNLYGHSCFEPAHLYAFNEKTFAMTLKASGYAIEHIKVHSAPKTFGWRSISALIKPSEQIRSTQLRQFFIPDWIKFQRRVGRSGTRHWYGYLYQQARKKLLGK